MFDEKQIEVGIWIRKITADSYRGWKAFYHTGAWKKKRKEILKRDHNSCKICRQNGKYTKAVTVHHIKHLRDVPELALTDNNLISLCRECHEKQHPERHKKRLGFHNIEKW